MKLVYFAQDLADPAVHRRIRMLREGFSDIILLGFRRSEEFVTTVDGVTPIDLGRTKSAHLMQRAGSVIATMVALDRHRDAIKGATVIIGRNLDMLVLAALARRRHAPAASLIFECLDIHWTMVSSTPVGLAVRQLESVLLRSCNLIVVSSPDFLTSYFNLKHDRLPPTLLLENKVLKSELEVEDLPMHGLFSGPPWQIGWFASLRCRSSLHLLSRLVQKLPGCIEVVLQGEVVWHTIPDFLEVVASTPGMKYLGPYNRRTDLAKMYTAVHFSWVIDFFGNYGNSQKLLPNRLYEGSLFGAVPIADRSVTTGRWLAQHNAGILFDDPIEESAIRFFETLDAQGYAQLKATLLNVPPSAFVYSNEECRHICELLAELPTVPVRSGALASKLGAIKVNRNA